MIATHTNSLTISRESVSEMLAEVIVGGDYGEVVRDVVSRYQSYFLSDSAILSIQITRTSLREAMVESGKPEADGDHLFDLLCYVKTSSDSFFGVRQWEEMQNEANASL